LIKSLQDNSGPASAIALNVCPAASFSLVGSGDTWQVGGASSDFSPTYDAQELARASTY
jgi:hypothetical protein